MLSQALEDVDHECGTKKRQQKVQQRHHCEQYDGETGEQHAQTMLLSHLSGRGRRQPAQGHELEILSAQQVAVYGKENDNIEPRQQIKGLPGPERPPA